MRFQMRAFPIGDYAGQNWLKYWIYVVCLSVYGTMTVHHGEMRLQVER